jgi:predicted unusual protein kinase regulating ubiquinone biosynthesis (AarF/ABC1/UbiB family)
VPTAPGDTAEPDIAGQRPALPVFVAWECPLEQSAHRQWQSPLVKGMNRRSQILRLLMRYRHSGVFSGMNLDAASSQADVPADGNPEQFVSDLEALGPTFVKLGQMLSTRPDMVPVEFATALERMQEKVAEIRSSASMPSSSRNWARR